MTSQYLIVQSCICVKECVMNPSYNEPKIYISFFTTSALSSVARQDIWLQLLGEDSSFLVSEDPYPPRRVSL